MKNGQIENKRNTGRTILKYCSCIPAIIMMVIIFKFSAANGVESSGTSSGLLEGIISKIGEVLPIEMEIQQKAWLVEVLETPLRKCAHMTEYMCLALFVMLPFYVFGKRGRSLICRSAVVSIVYACTDELHQYFVPGRAGRIMDICIDSIGVWIGIGIGMLFMLKMEKRIDKQFSNTL